VAKASVQRKAPTARKGRKPPRPQLDLFDDDAGGGKVVKMPAPAAAPVPLVAETTVPETAPAPTPSRGPRVNAEALAKKQREISVSEFFVKNRHLLGFDNPSKALLTTIKEAVDNSLDACEEAGILPELHVEVHDLGLEAKPRDAELTKGEGRFQIVVQDNGPGIVKAQVPKIFGKLLYGSKFHRLKQSLTADQNVLVERDGRIDRLPIGRLVDSLLADNEEVKDVSALGIRAPAFDRSTWRYEWRPVSHVIRHERENEILEVRTERGKRVRVTGCHSLFTYDSGLRQVKEVEARSLRAGDYIVAPRQLPEADHHGTHRESPVPKEMNPAQMRLLGLFLAEGRRAARQAGFTSSSREKNLAEAWCGRGAKRRVPRFVFQADPDMRQHFLDGLYLGDGDRVKTRDVLTLSSTSRELIEDVEMLWLMQGVVPCRTGPIRHSGLGRNVSAAWRLDVYGFDIGASRVYKQRDVQEREQSVGIALQATVGATYAATSEVEHRRGDVAAVGCLAASDLCLLRVNEVRRVRGAHPFVYDLSVPGCENFVAGDGALACHNSRGQQGIGISAAAMYGQLTTGKPIRVTSRVGKRKAAHVFDIQLDTRKNEPVVTHDEALEDWHQDHGTRVELEIVANWQQGQRFVNRYIEHTALANPHATIHYNRPVGAAQRENSDKPGNETLSFPRATGELPKEAVEIKPHPHGVELGALMLMARESKSHDVRGFMQTAFSRVSPSAAGEILAKVSWGKKPVRPRVLGANRAMAEELHKAIGETKLMNPPTNCLSPIGDELMKKGLVSFLNVIESEGEGGDENAQLDLDSAAMKSTKKTARAPAAGKQAAKGKAEPAPEQPTIPDAPPEEGVEKIKGHNYFIATVTRSPKVYRGNPFQVEVGLAYGGSWPPDKTIELFRFANRVPLLFQRGACGITDAIVRTDWRNYLLSQPKGSLPVGPMALLVHIASVWVPFTSESKEAVAHYPDILKEIQLAAQECGRKLATFIRKRKAADYQAQRRSIFELYIEEVAIAIGKITGRKPNPIKREFLQVAHKVTAAEMKEEEKAMELEAREAKQKAKVRAESEEEE
jgi:DNA topoisomerase VI subunit B